MDPQDRQSLQDLIDRTPEADSSKYNVDSAARLGSAASAVIAHAEAFNLDGSDDESESGLPAVTYIASLVADLLHLAHRIEPAQSLDLTPRKESGAHSVLEMAANYISDDGSDLDVSHVFR